MRALRRPLPALLLGLAALAGAPGSQAWAQEDPELRAEVLRVERSVAAMLEKAVAATVLIRAQIPGGGMGSGSGVLITTSGEILTCAHVVDMPGALLTVRLSDGRTLPATLVGRHSRHDYALLKLTAPPKDLPVAPMGDSTAMARRDWVVAMGHPLRPNRDNQPTVSVGVIRNMHARLAADMGRRQYPDVIMHDAPLFSGNSGGPLFDLKGNVVGINAAITLLNENGYSVPIGRIQKNLARLRAGEAIGPDLTPLRVDKDARGGALPGMQTAPVDEQLAGHLGIRKGTGEWVKSITPGTPADLSGLQPKDIVVAIDGESLAAGSLNDELAKRPPLSRVKLTVLRRSADDGSFEQRRLNVRLGRKVRR